MDEIKPHLFDWETHQFSTIPRQALVIDGGPRLSGYA